MGTSPLSNNIVILIVKLKTDTVLNSNSYQALYRPLLILNVHTLECVLHSVRKFDVPDSVSLQCT